MDSKIYDVLLGEYQDKINVLTQALARGSCAGIEEYRYICGQIRGLEAACATILDLKQRMEQNDE